jgi:hypothetical protein
MRLKRVLVKAEIEGEPGEAVGLLIDQNIWIARLGRSLYTRELYILTTAHPSGMTPNG